MYNYIIILSNDLFIPFEEIAGKGKNINFSLIII